MIAWPQIGERIRRVAAGQHVEHVFPAAGARSSRNGWARTTSACRSSTLISSPAAIATICCASTSSGFRGIRVSSISPSRIARATTALSSRSARNFGKILPFRRRPRSFRVPHGRCAAARAPPTWATRPGSRDRPRPCRYRARGSMSQRGTGCVALAFSVFLDEHALLARERAVMRPGNLALGELVEAERQALGQTAVVHEDDRRAVLVDELEDRRVDRRPDRACAMSGANAAPVSISWPSAWPRAVRGRPSTSSSRKSSTGTMTSMSSSLRVPASTSSIGRPPATKRPISSSGRWVRAQGDALERGIDEPLETLDGQGEMRAAALCAGHWHVPRRGSVSRRRGASCALGGQQQVERLWAS